MIMFFLPWWTYVLIGTVAMSSTYLAIWLANISEPGIRQEDGPYPCGRHLGTDEDGAEDWCWQMAGHGGDCLGMRQYFDADETGFSSYKPFRQTDAAGNVVVDESPDYLPESAPLPPLPQRLSKVPEQSAAIQGSGYTPAQLLGQTGHSDPWPRCGESHMNGACELAKGHPGDHQFLCF